MFHEADRFIIALLPFVNRTVGCEGSSDGKGEPKAGNLFNEADRFGCDETQRDTVHTEEPSCHPSEEK